MSTSPHDQSGHRVRLEQGPTGGPAVVGTLGAGGTDTGGPTCAVLVDVLSFTTTVSVAADRAVAVLPWRWRDRGEAARAFADEHAAELAVGRAEARALGGLSLSPASLRSAAPDLRRLVLPSPNGATTALALADTGAEVVAACLRNRAAVADWLADWLEQPGSSVALVPAGERWPDGTLRPAVEDGHGAGAVLASLLRLRDDLEVSPEARAALAGWEQAHDDGVTDLATMLRATSSGRELVGQGFDEDVAVAAELDTSTAVPVLRGTSFVAATGMRAL